MVAPADGGGAVPKAAATPPILERLEQLVNECSPSSTQAAARILHEYSANSQAAMDWDSFVQHNWLPILSLALGPEWRSRYDSEVAAMIALQLSVQPPAAAAAGPGTARAGAPSDGAAPSQAGAATGSSAPADLAAKGPAPLAAAAMTSTAAVEMGSSSYGTVEAQEMDGKRRRLRRKRAASPDSAYLEDTSVAIGAAAANGERVPAAASAVAPAAAGGAMAVAGGRAGHLPVLHTSDGRGAGAKETLRVDGSGSGAHKLQAGQQHGQSTYQRVVRQVAKLSMSGEQLPGLQQQQQQQHDSGDPAESSPAPGPASGSSVSVSAGAAPSSGDGPSSSTSSASKLASVAVALAAVPSAPAAPAAVGPASASSQPPALADGNGVAKGPGQGQVQQGLLDSLTLVHDLSARIVSNLQTVARARGLSLPPQMAAAAARGGAAGADAGADGPGGLLPLHMLLGGALVDRMDLLGRTALHVAAATGRADVVRQLAAAGACVNKPLPMDYRTLLKQHPEMEEERQHAWRRGAETSSGEADPDASAAGVEAAAALGLQQQATALLGQRAEEEEEEQASKRGRYVTGAAVPHVCAPSLQYCTPLHLAALHGHLDVVEALLAPAATPAGGGAPAAADPNARSLEGATPLHLAALGGHAAVVARLCRARGVLPDVPDHQGRTPLHVAAARGHDAVVVELWARGASIDPMDVHGWTPLHYAARGGHVEVAARLIIAGSHVQSCDPSGVAAAHLAAERGHAGIMERLLMAGYVADSLAGPLGGGTEGGAALHLAAANGHGEVVLCLLRSNVANGHFLMCGDLLDAGCWFTPAPGGAAEQPAPRDGPGDARASAERDGSAAGRETGALSPRQPVASADGSLGPVGLLQMLSHPAPHAQPGFGEVTGTEVVAPSMGLTFIECAARAGQLKAVQALVARGGVDLCGEDGGGGAGDVGGGCGLGVAVLGAAVLSQRADLVAWLLSAQGGGCSLDAALRHHDLLHEAASRGHVPCMAALLDAAEAAAAARGGAGPAGANSGAADAPLPPAALPDLGDQCRTPLHAALLHGQQEMALFLIERLAAGHAAALSASDANGWTPLHHAAFRGLLGVVAALLVQPSVSPDTATSDGQTALHLAAKAGHVGATHALLEARASASEPDDAGHLPIHYVALRGDLAFFNLLFAMSAASLSEQVLGLGSAGALLLSCAIKGGSSEMVGIVLLTGVTTPAQCAAAGQAPVHAAAKEGYLDVLQYLYGAGYDLTAVDVEGKTPLHCAPIGYGQVQLAAKRGVDHHSVAEVLLAVGCAPNAPDSHGCTPVHFAAGAGALGMLGRFLALAPRSADVADTIGWTPLFWACNNGHALAAERLLAEGANPWAQDCNQRLPLHFAAEAGHLACVRTLVAWMRRRQASPPSAAPQPLQLPALAAPAAPAAAPTAGGSAPAAPPPAPAAPAPLSLDIPDQNGQTPVQLAAEHGHPACVALLLDDAEGTGEGKRRGALHLAAAQGLAAVARQLLAPAHRRLAQPSGKDADGWSPMHHAAAGGHREVVQALLAAQAELDDMAADGDTPLHKATLGGHLAVVQLLTAARCQLDQRNTTGATPLYNAASQAHVAVVRHLAAEGASLDAPTTNGCTPLYIAANNGFVDATAALLELGADPDLETTSGCTALHAAALNGHAAVVARLVQHGCDMDAQSQNGSSALHNAASGGHVGVVDALIAARADCDVQNNNGNTPLHLAAGKGWAELVDRLLAAGADVHIRNAKGWTAIQSAANSGWFDIVLRMVQHGAAWRVKGDADVVKLLCKKSSYKATYIEGRLRIAEKERQRRLARAAEEAAAGGAAPSQEDQAARAAAADAVMAALLQEEKAAKDKAERVKAKKAARKQKKAAEQHAQQEAQAAEQAQEEEQGAEEAGSAASGADGVAAALGVSSLHDRPSRRANAPASASASEPPAASGGRGSRQAKQAGGAVIVAAPQHAGGKGGAALATVKTPVKRQQQAEATAAPSPRQQQHHTPAKLAPKPAHRLHSSNGGTAVSHAPSGQPAILPPRSASAAVVLRPAAGQAAAAAGGRPAAAAAPLARAAGPYAAAIAGQQPPAGPPITRPAPWASVAAAGLAAPALAVSQGSGVPAAANASAASAPLPVQRPQQVEPSFVPLFGLSLPSFGGLAGVDWSMPVGAGAATFGSPVRQPAAVQPPPPPTQPPTLLHTQQQQGFTAGGGAGAAGAPGGAAAISASSPSDASSIESSEADDLLNGIHGHVSRGLGHPHPQYRAVQPLAQHAAAAQLVKAAAPASMPMAAAGGDADGIDDVLRLQPWLGDM
eukprot:scaffold5.g878.t1